MTKNSFKVEVTFNSEYIKLILFSGEGIVTNLSSGIIILLIRVEEAVLWTKFGHLGIGF